MTQLRILWFRLRALFRAGPMDREIDDEIASHLAEATEEYVQKGLSPDEARRAARRSFGGVPQAKEVYREVRSFMWLAELRRDLLYAFRTLRKSPAFTTAAAATLALAIATNTVMFSVLDAVLLKPLPYRSPERLAMLWTEDPAQNLREGRSALWDVEQWQRQSQSFEDMATFDTVGTLLTGADGVEQIVGVSISANLLPLLGIQPALGRNFSTEEGEQRQPLVLISHGFWQARFAGARDALGATLVLNGVPSEIIGVLPADFQVARIAADVWVPHPTHHTARGGQLWSCVARLRPGVTFPQAQAEMSTVARRVNDQLSAAERNQGISVVPLSLSMVGPQSRLALWMLGGAVFCVFLIAAANVTSLSLARNTARTREMAVRAALGANAGRIVRQLITESVVLAVVSGVIGTLLAVGGIRLIRAFGPGNLARLNEVSLDLRVLGLALAISLLAGILVGLAPAMTTIRRDLRPSGEESGRTLSGGVSSRRIRRALVVAEFALAIVLLVGAGLLVRSWWYVANTDPGFKPERVLVMQVSSPPALSVPSQRADLYHRMLEQVQAVPGVESAGIIDDLFSDNPREFLLTVERNGGTASERLRLTRDEVSPDFFRAVGRRCSAAASFRSGIGPRLRWSRSSTRRWLGARGRGTIQWAEVHGRPAGFQWPLVHSRGRGRRHAAAGAGARTAAADLHVDCAESSIAECGSFHTDLVGRPADRSRGPSSRRPSRREGCADLRSGAPGRAARQLSDAAPLPDLAPGRLLGRGAADGRGRNLRAHPVLDRDAHA